MKRFVLALAAPIMFLFGLSSCGVSGQVTDDLTRLTVRIDGSSSLSASGYAILAVPPELVGGSVLISISGEGMEPLESRVDVQSEQDVIQASFLVPNGPDRRFWVYAYGQGGALLYTGHEHMDLDGTPVSVVVQMVPVQPDTTAPIFSGLESASSLSATSVLLSWSPALDDQTPEGGIVYLIYESRTPGTQDFQAPTYTTSPGVNSYTITGLDPGTTYFYVVRARDATGNVDANTVERSVQTQQTGDTTPPVFSGLDFVEIFPPGQATLFWLEASDDVSPPSAITYLIYEAQSPGGQNFQTPTYVTNPGETFFNLFNLTPGTTYYYVVRARDEAGNIDSNTVELAVQMP